MSEEQALAGSPPESTGSVGTGENGAGSSAGEAPLDVNGGGQRQSESIPYERFQQVNEPWQELKREAQQYGYEDPREYARALREAYEASAQQQSQDYTPTDYAPQPDPELQAMKAGVAQLMFQNGFNGLKERYPNADQAEVWDALSYGKFQGGNALERAMEQSHKRREALRQQAIAEYQEQLRKSAGAGAEGSGGQATGGGLDWGSMPPDEFQRRRQAMGVASG